MSQNYDIVIVGRGLIGASLACALASFSLRIAMIDAAPPMQTAITSHVIDTRAVALSYGSYRIFERMGFATELASQATPIHHIHVSDRKHFGFTRLHAEEERVPALGYVIDIRALIAMLNARLQTLSQITSFAPATLETLQATIEGWNLSIQTADGMRELSTKFLVGADGSDSKVRLLQNISSTTKDYGQSAITANIVLKRDHHQIAYERFTETGPLALLPLQGRCCSLVWTLPHEQAKQYVTFSDAQFLQQLQRDFGYRLGRFMAVGQRSLHALSLVQAQQVVIPGSVLIGNAAHTLHPIAGQGFNLGLRDVSVLAEQLLQAQRMGQALNDRAIVQAYHAARQSDQKSIIQFTDRLVSLFSNSNPACVIPRNLSLLFLDHCSPLKSRLTQRAMGLVS